MIVGERGGGAYISLEEVKEFRFGVDGGMEPPFIQENDGEYFFTRV
jgi:hypothetical protein